MTLKRIAVLLALALTPSVRAAADQLADQLINDYQHQTLALRFPIGEQGQEFDADGKPLGTARGGSWMLYSGLIFIEKVKLKADRIDLEGDCLIYPNGRTSWRSLLGHPLKLRIRLEHPLRSLEETQQVMGRVFFLDKESLRRAKPEYRRAGDADGPIYDGFQDKSIRRPRATYAPEPDLSDEARKARYQGTVVLRVVVDKNGLVSRIGVERALGMGLDAQAVSTVRTWRFQPAMREGQPVAVALSVEVSFQLF